jgi:hypothetical protein
MIHKLYHKSEYNKCVRMELHALRDHGVLFGLNHILREGHGVSMEMHGNAREAWRTHGTAARECTESE